jgi:hypothetical protein
MMAVELAGVLYVKVAATKVVRQRIYIGGEGLMLFAASASGEVRGWPLVTTSSAAIARDKSKSQDEPPGL